MSSLLNIKHGSKFSWQRVKPYVQQLTQSKDSITLSFDDSIDEKIDTDDSELNFWHYGHSFNRSVKGVEFLKKDTIVAYVKLEWHKQRKHKNHFAMKAQIYLAAQKAAQVELAVLSKSRSAT